MPEVGVVEGDAGEVIAITVAEFGGKGDRGESGGVDAAIRRLAVHDPGDAVIIRMYGVEGEFVMNPDPDKESNGDAGGEAGEVEDRVEAAIAVMAPGCF